MDKGVFMIIRQYIILPESISNKNYWYVACHRYREVVTAQTIDVSKEGTLNNVEDLFTKIIGAAGRNCLLGKCIHYIPPIVGYP